MKKISYQQPNVASVSSYPQSNYRDSDTRDSAKYSPSHKGLSPGVLITGFLTTSLLILLAYFLVIRPHSQKAIVQTAASAGQTAAEDNSLISATGLSLEAQHPNGTVLQVKGISFEADRTTVQLTIINTREPRNGLIRLNQAWGALPNTMILKDDFGVEYPLIPAGGNSTVEVKPGTTMTREFSFRGKMNPSTQTVTLITNSKGGSPTNEILQTPLIEVEVTVNSL